MNWGAAIIGALVALPKLVESLDKLGDSIKNAALLRVDNKYEKLKEQVNEYTRKIEKAETNDERRSLARELNSIVSR